MLKEKEELGKAILEALEMNGYSRADAARKFGLKAPSITGWVQTGRISKSNFDELRRWLTKTPSSHWGDGLPDLKETEHQQNFEDGPTLHGSVPLISWVQAGNWEVAFDLLSPGEGERIETTWKAKAHTYALRVRGDSMEPLFPNGCIIIVEPEECPSPGDFVIVRQNGDEATFKQYIEDGSSKFLKPLNDRYPIMEMRKDAVFCGVIKRMEMDIKKGSPSK